VIAEGGPVDAERVQHPDHLPAGQPLAVHARGAERRRRHVVAAERGDERRVLRLERRAQARDPRQAAGVPGFDRGDFVDVVEVQDGDGGGRRLRAGRRRDHD
jgi:hypothetical protein